MAEVTFEVNGGGLVEALMRAGKDMVETAIPEKEALRIVENGTLVKSEESDYPICVEHEWYFRGTVKKIKKA